MRERMEELGKPNPWSPPADATPEQLAEFEAFQARMLVPDEAITTWVDISGSPIERKWAALHEHVTQIAEDQFFMAFGLEGWREQWSKEAYILRESTVDTPKPEDDLFAGLA
jgi:LmbE family N-acetylglucosaminyl deacetylase